MRSVVVWADKVHDRDGLKQCIYAVAFKPDGTQLIAAAGNRVLVYETADGELITSLKGHKDTVYCVSWSRDGKLFASGAADKTVIVWSDDLQGRLKYSHNDPIQCVAFNTTSNKLASCTTSDFGYWWEEQKSVNKHKTNSRICTCSWTNDGQYLALGLFNGNVSIRNKDGEEKVLIQRPGGAPVWSLQFNPSPTEKVDVLAVTDWGQKLSFYMLSGRQVMKERDLDFDPCCVGYFTKGEYIVMGGSDKSISLYTKEGVKLTTIGEQEGWVWSCAVRPNQNYVAVGCHDGTIALYQLIFSTVHGLYKDRYAYRKNMTDVVIQDLISEKESKIRCRNLVKKIAIYKATLAVQLPNQINIYDIVTHEDGTADAKIKGKIRKKFDCNLLVVCSKNVILCQERKLQCLSFDGVREREWVMDSTIRYIKVTGGPEGREGLLVGLKNGQIVKIFVDNQFPIELIKQQTAVRCLDLSPNRKKLAVVDDNNTCLVYDLTTKSLLFQEPHANSVVFNTQNEDMLCFSGNGMLHIKAADFPIHQQKLQGFVVGFNGSNIYCLHVYAMTRVEVPQSQSMYQYLNNKQYEEAYAIACLGVTEADWRALALECLEGLNLGLAKSAFIRVRDIRFLDLIYSMEERRSQGAEDEDEFLGDIYAYQGRFEEAAKHYVKAGLSEKAMNMYCDLRQFDKAKEVMPQGDANSAKMLMKKQADWCKTAKDPTLAIDILSAAGEDLQSVDIMGENGMHQKLIEKARGLNKAEAEVLSRIAHWLKHLDQIPYAAEVYQKIGDNKMLIDLYVSANKWDSAFSLAEKHPEMKRDIYLPYANWLAETDRFEQAQEAYRNAGMEEKAREVLEVLTHNSVVENRFDDAGYYFWQLSQQVLQHMSEQAGDLEGESGEPDEEEMQRFLDYQVKSEMYYAYHSIQRYIEEPFTSHLPESLFNIARFLLHGLQQTQPFGISKVSTLFALAKQSRNLGAYKLARHAYEKLQGLRIPPAFREHIDVGSITIRSKPFSDKDDLLPLCYRCSSPNPLLSGSKGNICATCQQPFVLSFHSFEGIPLVEFFLDIDVSDEEALRLIRRDTLSKSGGSGSGSADVMTLDSNSNADEFNQKLAQYDQGGTNFEPVRVDRSILSSLPTSEVFVQKWPAPLHFRYFKNVMPEIPLSMCEFCFKFFHTDDFDLLVLQNGHCPFCHNKKASDDDTVKIVAGAATQSSMA